MDSEAKKMTVRLKKWQQGKGDGSEVKKMATRQER